MSQSGIISAAASSPAIPTSFVTDSGIAIPVANVLNVLGTDPINTAGAGNTVTISIEDPLTVPHGGTGNTIFPLGSIPIGEGVADMNSLSPGAAGTIVRSNGAAVDPAYTQATYPAMIASGQVLIGQSTNVIDGLNGAAGGVLAFDNTAYPAVITPGSSGLVLTSVSGNSPVWAAAQQGVNSWVVVTGTTQAMAVNTGYIANNAGQVVATLPATSAVGDMLAITGINNATGWRVAQNAGNQIFFGSATPTTAGVGGSITSIATRDTITLVCTSANANWQVISSIGSMTIV